jgi:murein DD-endopeptidase MepM/ murein hydrolase activator NlpD
MSKEKRRGGPVLLASLGGFALGAATVLFVVWVYGVLPAGPAGGEGAAPVAQPPGTVPKAPPGGAPGAWVPGNAPPAAPAPGTPLPGAPPPSAGTPLPGVPPPGAPSPGASPPAAGVVPAPPPLAAAGDVEALRSHQLLLPVQGIRREQLRDSFSEGRAGHAHEAIDIMAERSTPVMAVEDGRLVKLFLSAQGGNTIYQFDPSQTYAYYYAHLDRYAGGLREGDQLRRGQVIGFVGSTGNAPPNAPHLHFAIFRLTPDKHWWRGTAIDPFLVLRQP